MQTHNDWEADKPSDEMLGNYHRRLHAVSERVIGGHIEYQGVMDSLQGLLDNKRLTQSSLLPSPRQQLCLAKLLNSKCGWGLDSNFDLNHQRKIEVPPEHQVKQLGPLQAFVLDVRVGSFYDTVKTVLHIIWESQVNAWMPESVMDSFEPTEHSSNMHQGSVWRIVDFGAGRKSDRSVESVIEKRKPLPNTAVLWALVYNPMLLDELRTMNIRSLWIGGFTFESRDGREMVPVLSKEDQCLFLRAGHPKNETDGRAIPEFIDI